VTTNSTTGSRLRVKLGIGSCTYTWAVGVRGHAPLAPFTLSGLLRKAAVAKEDAWARESVACLRGFIEE
jgi:hypothetical protein